MKSIYNINDKETWKNSFNCYQSFYAQMKRQKITKDDFSEYVIWKESFLKKATIEAIKKNRNCISDWNHRLKTGIISQEKYNRFYEEWLKYYDEKGRRREVLKKPLRISVNKIDSEKKCDWLKFNGFSKWKMSIERYRDVKIIFFANGNSCENEFYEREIKKLKNIIYIKRQGF